MLSVLEDTVKNHFVPCPGRCSPMINKLRSNVIGNPTCQENLAEALAPYGIGSHEVPDVFNMFMNAGIDENGLIYIRPSKTKKGDYMELQAEPKPVGVRIFRNSAA
jgi:hypothetical protein